MKGDFKKKCFPVLFIKSPLPPPGAGLSEGSHRLCQRGVFSVNDKIEGSYKFFDTLRFCRRVIHFLIKFNQE
ncbi:MAG: hypothetical protein A2Y81_10940 [Nitrospirae bacterium RBG_13_43_8]|nr:MAG: hypothetical protein A2Y81_10940 [Nitrospirae bacterium RBG_13_43_8]